MPLLGYLQHLLMLNSPDSRGCNYVTLICVRKDTQALLRILVGFFCFSKESGSTWIFGIDREAWYVAYTTNINIRSRQGVTPSEIFGHATWAKVKNILDCRL
jgi:hypothetical protein